MHTTMQRSLIASIAPVLWATVTFGLPAEQPSQSANVSAASDHQWGRATWFHPGLGNCGQWNSDGDPIIAISTSIYNSGSNCNQWIEVSNTANGRKGYGFVRDSCPGCNRGDLDLSPSLFQQLDSLDRGVLQIQWKFL